MHPLGMRLNRLRSRSHPPGQPSTDAKCRASPWNRATTRRGWRYSLGYSSYARSSRYLAKASPVKWRRSGQTRLSTAIRAWNRLDHPAASVEPAHARSRGRMKTSTHMIDAILAKVFGTRAKRELDKMRPIVAAINDLEPLMQGLSGTDLAAKTIEFKGKLAQGAPLDDLLIEAFAVVRETGRRFLNMRHFDVQLIGGIVLHQAKIAEMKTGEGKTLVATLPASLNALEGKGVHIVTVNDYLA